MKETCGDKGKGDNKKGSGGETLKCSSCESNKHLMPQCPHSWENLSKIAEGETEDSYFTNGFPNSVSDNSHSSCNELGVFFAKESEEVKVLGGLGPHIAIIDTGCNKPCAGEPWTNQYLEDLPREDKDRVKVVTTVKPPVKFRFGGGTVFEAIKTITAPVQFGSKKKLLTWHVVKAPIPLLWGKDSMRKAEVLLDLPNDRARILGEWVELISSN